MVYQLKSSPGSNRAESAVYVGEHPLAPAEKRPLDLETLTEKLGRLGGTPFHLDRVELLTTDKVFAPTSELNQARRQLVDELFDSTGELKPIAARPIVEQQISELQTRVANSARQRIRRKLPYASARSHARTIGCRDRSRPLNAPLASITLDYLELYGLRPSIERIRDAGIRPRVASPRILKPSEQNVIRFLTSLECDILVRSGGLLHDLVNGETAVKTTLIGDFSLNAANGLSCRRYLDLGLTRITPTYDLNAQQVADLTNLVPAAALEVIAYSHLPVFHTEHCVFCRFLSDGTDNTNCGHPCEKHRVAVRDGQGRIHPVMADVGCRNTVFGAEAQVDPSSLLKWRSQGISHFRLEFVHQTPQQVQAITSGFQGYFCNQLRSKSRQSPAAFKAIFATN